MKKTNAKTITKYLIDFLNNKYIDKTITTEISVNTSYGTKVADVVLSNGHSIAFEIKSELDNTLRLDEQVKGFSEIFDYVYLVYWGEKFLINNLSLPENIGAIEAKWHSDKIVFKVIKSAKINRIATSYTIAKMLWKDELFYFLNKKGVQTKKSFDKNKLVNLFVSSYNKTESVKLFRFILKKRFEKGFKKYMEIKDSPNSLNAFKDYKVDFNYLSFLK